MDRIAIKTISLYPIKALDPILVPAACVLSGGSLQHDREFALVDSHGKWINAKREPKVHLVRAQYDLATLRVTLSSPENTPPKTFNLIDDARAIEDWFTNFFGYAVTLQRNTTTGFPDDLDSPGPTIVGSASLSEVRSWFALPDTDEVRRRFRANIELDTDTPFWEDRLFGATNTALPFRIGDVAIQGMNPCQRCPCAVARSIDRNRHAGVPASVRREARRNASGMGRQITVRSLLPPDCKYEDPCWRGRQVASMW
jgi:uncharacterized protein YcbX